jgi:hypothetical protein
LSSDQSFSTPRALVAPQLRCGRSAGDGVSAGRGGGGAGRDVRGSFPVLSITSCTSVNPSVEGSGLFAVVGSPHQLSVTPCTLEDAKAGLASFADAYRPHRPSAQTARRQIYDRHRKPAPLGSFRPPVLRLAASGAPVHQRRSSRVRRTPYRVTRSLATALADHWCSCARSKRKRIVDPGTA